MKLSVNKSQRIAKMRAHTATHLLHAEICKFLPNTKQLGSLVDEDLVRFDFAATHMLSEDQIMQIEKNISNIIKSDNAVTIYEKNIADAKAMGAKAFFEDKYGDIVRVVCIESENDVDLISIELCGGTHVSSTGQIGIFKIIGQQSIASGTKRITAYTGPKVLEYIYEQNELLNNIAEKLSCEPKQAPEKLEKVIKDLAIANSQVESYKSGAAANIKWTDKSFGSTMCNIYILEDNLTLKDISNYLKGKEGNYIYADKDGGFVIYSSSKQAKIIQAELGIKGGGSDQMIQGKDESILRKTMIKN